LRSVLGDETRDRGLSLWRRTSAVRAFGLLAQTSCIRALSSPPRMAPTLSSDERARGSCRVTSGRGLSQPCGENSGIGARA